MIRRVLVVLIAGMLAGGCGALIDAPPDASPSELAPAVTPDAPASKGIAGVALPTLNQDSFRRKATQITMRVRNLTCEGVASGSGFAIDRDTLVTNRHVVAGAEFLEVDTADGRSLKVSAAQVGVLGDIAFVTIDGTLPVSANLNGRAGDGPTSRRSDIRWVGRLRSHEGSSSTASTDSISTSRERSFVSARRCNRATRAGRFWIAPDASPAWSTRSSARPGLGLRSP